MRLRLQITVRGPLAAIVALGVLLGVHASTDAVSERATVAAGSRPPTAAFCRAHYGVPCYGPDTLRAAYGLTPVLDAGHTGRGQSIVIVDSYGSPTIAHDLTVFDAGFHLPAPPSFHVVAPLGTVPFDPHNKDELGWAAETTLDVEWAHAMAPDAAIVLLTSPVDETEGVQGMPQFLALERYALDHHLGAIISQSWGATENTLFTTRGRLLLRQFNQLYKQAAREHVTVLAAAGDGGSANPDSHGKLYHFPTVGFPASSPWVTAVGGTSLHISPHGGYGSETVWNDEPLRPVATGGGVSQYFTEPRYQRASLPAADQKLLNGHRGLPDVAWSADRTAPILIYQSFVPGAKNHRYVPLGGGTSAGSPQWAGMIADANQWAGRPLGFLNPALYAVGAAGGVQSSQFKVQRHPSPQSNADNLAATVHGRTTSGAGAASGPFHDITVGDNGVAGIPGYRATVGWDLASGWGTPNAAVLLPKLIGFKAQSSRFNDSQPIVTVLIPHGSQDPVKQSASSKSMRAARHGTHAIASPARA